MFGSTDDIRRKTEECNKDKDQACYGGVSGRLSYEASNARTSCILPRLALGAAMFLFFGVLGTLCAVIMFNIVNTNLALYYPSANVDSVNAEDAVVNPEGKLLLSDVITNVAVIRNTAAVENITEEQSKRYRIPVGVMIHELSENGPLYEAGIVAGDIIVEFDGTAITDCDQLSDLLKSKKGQTVGITVFRNNTNVKLFVFMG